MLQQLQLIKEIRNDVQNSREEVLFQHKKFMEELALKKREQNTESLIATVLVNNLYEEGLSLLNEAKSIVCSNEADFVKKAELLDDSQKLLGVASEVVEFLISEEMPTRFFKNNGGGLLEIKGLLKLMNQGKFNAVDLIIKEFIPCIDVDKEVLDNAFNLFESISLRQVKSFEDLYNLISGFAEKQEEDECSYELAEKESDEESYGFDLDVDSYGLEEKESDEYLENVNFFGLAEKQSDEELYGLEEKESDEESYGFDLDVDSYGLEEKESDECSYELAEKESDESMYLLQEKESDEDFPGFDLDEEHKKLEKNMKKIWEMHDESYHDDSDFFKFDFSEDLDDPILNPEYLKDSDFAI